jgi:hypothetical protein
MLRGFSPCAMPIIPSITISRDSDRPAIATFSLLQTGRKNRFARPMP